MNKFKTLLKANILRSMTSDRLSEKEKIDLAKEWKEHILRSSQLIRGHIERLVEKGEKNDDYNIIKREINSIIKYLSDLSAFCNKDVNEIIDKLIRSGVEFVGKMDFNFFIENRSLITRWASTANAISLDFTKSPFSLSSGIKISLKFIEAFLKGEYSTKI